MIFKIKRFSDSSEEKRKQKKNKRIKIATGTGLLLGGGKLLKDSKSKITGLENFYHSADESVIDSIKKEGIKSRYSVDPDNFTNSIIKDVDPSKLKGKVYLGKKKSVADGIGASRDLNYQLGNIKNKKYKGKSKTLKVNIPFEELKKMKEVDNPELRGAKNRKDFIKRTWRNVYKKDPTVSSQISNKKLRNFLTNVFLGSQYKSLSKKGTATFENDIDSKFIKESKNYKKYGLDEFKEYVKNNPDRFKSGLKKAGIGIGLGISGAALIGNELKKKKKKEEKENKRERD